jgi:hypothetical protein
MAIVSGTSNPPARHRSAPALFQHPFLLGDWKCLQPAGGAATSRSHFGDGYLSSAALGGATISPAHTAVRSESG